MEADFLKMEGFTTGHLLRTGGRDT